MNGFRRPTASDLEELFGEGDRLRRLRELVLETGFRSDATLVGVNMTRQGLLSSTFRVSGSRKARQLLESGSAVEMLVAMFMLGGAPIEAAFDQALSGELGALLRQCRLVDVDGGRAVPRYAMTEYDSQLFLSDLLFVNLDGRPQAVHEPDVVMPPHFTSTSMAQSWVDLEPGKNLLDVGCGSGFLALFKANRYSHVDGVDLNARAIPFSKINARLNDIQHASFFVGDCRNLAADRKYAQVVFNAPSLPTYRDDRTSLLNNTSVLGYDIVLEFLHRAMPELLTEDGFCHIWSIFAVPAGDTPYSFLSRVLGEVPGFSFDVTLWPQSPFSLSPEEIERGQVRLGSLLLTEPEDRNRLLDFVHRQELSQLVTTTLVARRSASPAITFEQASWN